MAIISKEIYGEGDIVTVKVFFNEANRNVDHFEVINQKQERLGLKVWTKLDSVDVYKTAFPFTGTTPIIIPPPQGFKWDSDKPNGFSSIYDYGFTQPAPEDFPTYQG